jgi:hypothetical protein
VATPSGLQSSAPEVMVRPCEHTFGEGTLERVTSILNQLRISRRVYITSQSSLLASHQTEGREEHPSRSTALLITIKRDSE